MLLELKVSKIEMLFLLKYILLNEFGKASLKLKVIL